MLVCSNTGFSETAIRKAKRKKIGLIAILRHGDERIKAIIEEEIYICEINLGPVTFSYTFDKPIPKPNIGIHDLKYKGGSVDAWLQVRAGAIVSANPNIEQRVTATFNLKEVTSFNINGHEVRLRALSITFHPHTEWLSQVVQIDATAGIYDYVRGRVRLAAGNNSYIIKGINFDTATPLSSPPDIGDRGFGLRKDEVNVSLAMVKGLDLPTGIKIAAIEDLIVPKDLDMRVPAVLKRP